MIKNEKGNVTITVLVFCVCLFAAIFLVTDIAKLYSAKVSARQGLNLALRGAADQLCEDRLADWENPRAVINPQQAEQVFYNLLKKNLRLDDSLDPYVESIADDRVTVERFYVVNSEPFDGGHSTEGIIPDGDYFTYTYNYENKDFTEQIKEVSATGIIRVPVKLSSLANVVGGIDRMVELYVHSTAGPQLIPQENSL